MRPPFDGPEVIGAAFARALAVDPNYFKCDEDKAALSASRDVRTMCDAAPTITAAAFRARLAAAGPALRDDFAVLRPKDTKHSLRRGAASVSASSAGVQAASRSPLARVLKTSRFMVLPHVAANWALGFGAKLWHILHSCSSRTRGGVTEIERKWGLTKPE